MADYGSQASAVDDIPAGYIAVPDEGGYGGVSSSGRTIGIVRPEGARKLVKAADYGDQASEIVPNESSEGTSRSGAFGEGLLQGATMGASGRIESGVGTALANTYANLPDSVQDATFGKVSPEDLPSYNEARQQKYNETQTNAQEYPLTNIAGNIVGSIPTALAGGAVLKSVAPKGASFLANSGSRLTSGLKGVAMGAGQGAVTGAMEADPNDPNAMADNATNGALVGGATGGLLNTVLLKQITRAPISNDIKEGLFGATPDARVSVGEDLSGKLTAAEQAARQAKETAYTQAGQVKAAIPSNSARELADSIDQSIAHLDPEVEKSVGPIRRYTQDLRTEARSKPAPNTNVLELQDQLKAGTDELGKLKELEQTLIDSVNSKAQLSSRQGGFWRNRSITASADEARSLANVRNQIEQQSKKISDISSRIDTLPKEIENSTIKYSTLENLRKRINAIPYSAETAQGKGAAKAAFDNYIDKIVDDGLIKGDKKAIELIKEARARNAYWAQTFSGKNADKAIKKFIDSEGEMSPEGVTKLFTNLNDAGFQSAKAIKDALGEEGITAVKRGYLNNLGLKSMKDGKIDPKKLSDNAAKFLKDSPTIAKTILTQDEYKSMQAIAATQGKVGLPKLAKFIGKGAGIMGFMGEALGSEGGMGHGLIGGVVGHQAGNVIKKADRAVAMKQLQNPVVSKNYPGLMGGNRYVPN